MSMRSNVLGLLALTIFFAIGYPLYALDSASAETESAFVAKPEALTSQSAPAADIPSGQLGTNVTPTRYELELTLIPEKSGFSGKVDIDVSIRQASGHIFLHGQGLDVGKVTLQQGSLTLNADYTQVHDSGIARIDLPQAVSGDVRLTFSYQAPYSQSLDAIYQVKESGISYLFSQMEAIAARMAIPSFDEPLFKTPFAITIITAAKNKVITNTPEISRETLENGWIKRNFAITKPLPTYLLAFAVGEFDVVEWPDLSTSSIRDVAVPLRGVAAKGKGEKMKFALENTQAIVEALERFFGTPYPYSKLDLIAAPDFGFGAMENAGAIVYREDLLLMEKNAPLEQIRAYGSVHAHELAHQWFGNLVTPKWWDDIWLNESFATWVSYKAVQQWRNDLEFERTLIEGSQWAMRVHARSSARQIRNPIKSNDDIMNAFDGITYEKGGGVLQMFENYLGEAKFRKGVQLHMQRFAHSTADINDFLKSIADGSGNPDVVPAFESFLYQSGVPLANVEVQCKAKQAALQIVQSRYVPLGVKTGEKQLWQIPLCYRTDKAEGCELITKSTQTVALDHCPQWVMLNRDGAGYFRWNLTAKEWSKLVDQVENLNAAEQLSVADNLIAAFKAGSVPPDVLLSALNRIAGSAYWDVASIPADELSTLRHVLLADQYTKEYQSYIATLYRPLFDQLGYWPNTDRDKNNASGSALLRTNVVQASALEARDADVRAQLTNMAKKYLRGADGELNTEAINPNLISLALAVAVEQGNREFVEQLKSRALKSTDAEFRGNALNALTYTTDLELGKQLMNEMLLSKQVRSNEAQQLIWGFINNPLLRDASWSWVKENVNDFVKRYSSFSAAQLVSLGSVFCDNDAKKNMGNFFIGVETKIPGAPRKIKETTEVVEQCIALRERQADAFRIALKSVL